MKTFGFTRPWFPHYRLSASGPVFFDHQYADFDEQAEQLAGHDQSYLQLTRGAFDGRFLSAFLGPYISIHLEFCNQALEQKIGGSASDFSFGLVLDGREPFRANGRAFTADDLMVVPPGGDLVMRSPVDGCVAAIVVDRERLFADTGLDPDTAHWLDNLHGDIGMLRSPNLTRRLREDLKLVLESASADAVQSANACANVGNAFIGAVVSHLSLEHAAGAGPRPGAASYGLYLECRSRFHSDLDRDNLIDDLARSFGTTKRSLQGAFSANVSVGPLTYLRIVRLHRARRELLCLHRPDQSIGDIAAANGFWNWSEFSRQYQRQFGELPSQTRARRQIA